MIKIFQSIFCILLITTGLINQTKGDLPLAINLDEFSCQNYMIDMAQEYAPGNQIHPVKNIVNFSMWMEGAVADSTKILPTYFINEVITAVVHACSNNRTSPVFVVYQAEREKLLTTFDKKKIENESFDIAKSFCSEALDKNRNFLGGAMVFIFWINGFGSKENFIDFNNMEKLFQQAESKCRQNPEKPIFNLVQQIILTN